MQVETGASGLGWRLVAASDLTYPDGKGRPISRFVQATASTLTPRPADAGATPPRDRARAVHGAWWLLAATVVIAGAIFVIALTGMRPGYDAFGWLVWGHQVLHWNLNTDGAPSWKPVALLFTLPYALAGSGQMWLWMVTAVGGALAGTVFAARIAYRLTGPSPRRPYAPLLAAAFAGFGVLGIDTYSHLVLITSSDPMIVTFCLAAIDFHLHRRRRLAFAMLVLASLGRPDAWAFTGLYAIWAWHAVPPMRVLAVLGIALIPAFWFSIPALTSKSWFTPGNLALTSISAANVIHGSKIAGVIDRFGSLYALPMQLAALFGVALAVLRRDRVTLTLAAAACLWVAIEIGLALHGWSGAARYLIEPGAVMVVLAGAAVGRVLAYAPQRPAVLRWVGPVAGVGLVAVLAVALVPTVRQRVQTARADIATARFAGTQISRLQAVIVKDGGAARILACGQPVTLVGLQSKVAWAVGLNVGNVGYRPGRSIASGLPIVVLKPHRRGWQVRPVHMRRVHAARCRRLKADSAFG